MEIKLYTRKPALEKHLIGFGVELMYGDYKPIFYYNVPNALQVIT